MDIGDIIYFLFVIGGIVYSVVKKSNSNKKKRNGNEPSRTTSSRNTSIDDDIEKFLRSISGETETPKPAQATTSQYNSEESHSFFDQEEPELYNDDDQPTHQPNLYELKKQQAQNRTQKEKELLNKEISANSPIYSGDLSNQQDAKSEFNLRKAVIYDAIMNRPKY